MGPGRPIKLICPVGRDTVISSNFTTLMAAVLPTSSSSLTSGNSAKSAAPPLLLFEKKYDALPFPQYNLLNDFGGNCITGQLLTEGYKQEMTNGQHLRNAYVYDSKSKTNQHDPRMSLFDVAETDTDDAALWQSLYYRAGDDQRTLVSGQALLQGMLGPELERHVTQNNGQYPRIPLHTVDYARDILYPNEVLCPRLVEMRERFEKSRDYLLFNESQEVKTLRHFQQAVLGTDQDMSMDCLMNTICTDRPLPDAINDYIGGDEHNVPNMRVPHNDTDYGSNLFLRLYNFYVRQYTISVMANDAEYAKLAMGPLWAEIVDNIQAVVQEQRNVPNSVPPRPVPKLALFSGQDTTLIPLLASLGWVYDERWPPYASMLLIEIHEINLDGRKTAQKYASDFAFRLIYNGQVITKLFCRGNRELCDVQLLLYSVSKFAIRERADQCQRQFVAPQVYVNAVPEATQMLSSSGGWSLLLLIIIISATVGSAMTFWYLVYQHPAGRTVDWREGGDSPCHRRFLLGRLQLGRLQRRKYQVAPIVDDDGIALMRLDLAVHYRDADDDREEMEEG